MTVHILCGNDEVAIDKAFLSIRAKYAAVRSFEPPFVFGEVEDALVSENLFGNDTLVVLSSFVKGSRRGILPKATQDIVPLIQSTQTDIVLIELDEKKVASYKKIFPKAQCSTFSIPKHLFYFLDGLYPSNLTRAYSEYKKTVEASAPDLVFYFLKRRMRELVLLSEGTLTGSYLPWQKAKLQSQLMRWKKQRLVSAYKSLYRLERDMKSGATPYGADKSISLFLSFYL